MEEKRKIGIIFIIYMIGELLIGVLSLYLYKKGILIIKPGVNVLLFGLIVQVAAHIGINIYGYVTGKSDLFRDLYTFSVPPIIMVLISWYNTF